MAKGQQGKKASTGTRNPDRKCGKAWKKHPKKPAHLKPVTEERHLKNILVANRRAQTKIENQERRRAEELAAQVAAEVSEAVQLENKALKNSPAGAKKQRREQRGKGFSRAETLTAIIEADLERNLQMAVNRNLDNVITGIVVN